MKYSICIVIAVICVMCLCGQSASQEKNSSNEPSIPIDFVGFLPGTQDVEFSGSVEVEFSIYLTPTGGRPVWSEKQSLNVSKGRVVTKLGLKTPIPWSLTIGNFKFASARINGGSEVLPRMPIVNVVYSSSVTMRKPAQEYENAPVPERKPRTSTSWSEAQKVAQREGKRLPTYLEWYSAAASGRLDEFAGHYEWTLPWIYDTASQSELNDYFRGRLQGCDYMDLDPQLNSYPYRLCESR